jgi:O-antigen ligase
MITIASINLSALIILIKHGLPRPFPWLASAWLGMVLLIWGIVPPGGIERAVGFVTILSSMITAKFILHRFPSIQIHRIMYGLAIALSLFILVDAFRWIPTPDIAMVPGESYTAARRPYALEHPNVTASWLLLLSLTPVSFMGIWFAQSRGALMGYMAALFRFIPKRFYLLAFIVGSLLLTAVGFLRPGTFFGRTAIWQDALTMFLASPIYGHGTGTYLTLAGNGMATAHNAALTIAAENGVIGLLAFGAWIYHTATHVMRSTDPLRFNLLAFTVQQIVDDQWLHPINAVLIGVVLSVCIFQEKNIPCDPNY